MVYGSQLTYSRHKYAHICPKQHIKRTTCKVYFSDKNDHKHLQVIVFNFQNKEFRRYHSFRGKNASMASLNASIKAETLVFQTYPSPTFYYRINNIEKSVINNTPTTFRMNPTRTI